nr:serine/arginine repetitive matrix protein 1 [Oryctolagus cuniculus]
MGVVEPEQNRQTPQHSVKRSSCGRAAGVEFRRRRGRGRRDSGVGAARRRRRPPNFAHTRRRFLEGVQARGGSPASPPAPPAGRASPTPLALRRDTRPRPRPPPFTAAEGPSPTPPRDVASGHRPGRRRATRDPAAARRARRRPEGGPARRRPRRRARRSPSFPPFLLAQTRPGRTGPLALCLLLLLLHGAMRLGGGSREKWARERAGRAARTGRGVGGRRAGGGGSGGAAAVAGKN